MIAAADAYDGSCLCGKIAYRARGPLGTMDHCHCTDCRKSHGAAFATYLEVPWEGFEIRRGKEALVTYTAESGTKRSFCPTCGSTLLCWVDGDPMVEIAAGTLDTPVGTRPQSHSFVRSKVAWFDIQDGLPQYATTRGSKPEEGAGG